MSRVSFDTARNRLAVRLANAALKIGSRDHRLFVAGAIEYGMRAAAQDVRLDRAGPPDWRSPSSLLTQEET